LVPFVVLDRRQVEEGLAAEERQPWGRGGRDPSRRRSTARRAAAGSRGCGAVPPYRPAPA
jgi:hypothetical protein